jgi:Bacterial Ig-like domain
LSQGQHTFEVRAIDAQSDADPTPATRTWAVDTVGPAVDIDQPLTQSTITDPTPTFSGTAGTAFGDLPEVRVRIRNEDGQIVQEMTRTPSGSTWSATAGQLADGNYTVEVEQRDQIDHLGTDSAEFTLEGDFVAPAVSIATPANGSSTSDATPRIAGTAGTQPGDQSTVAVEIRSGSTVVQSLTATRDGSGAWETTAAEPLALGTYTVQASQQDNVPNTGTAQITFSVVDSAAPAVTISSPANGSTTADSTPDVSGGAGTAAGDASGVTVLIRRSGGGLVQSLTAPVSGGGWSTTASALADGTYTAQAEQSDASGNVGRSAVSTFTVDTSGPSQAPSFLLAPVEDRMADVLAGRLTVIAACAGACQVEARLTVSPRASRNLGLGRKSTALGSGRKRLTKAGTAATAVRLTKKARAALRGESSAKATLRVKLTGDAGTMSLSRTISLQRSAGLQRIASRGLRFWALCSETCPLSGKLTMAAPAARKIGLKPKGSTRMQVASGRATAAAKTPTRLTLKVRRGARKALRKARRAATLLEAVAGPPNLSRTAKRSMTLRR